MAQRFFPISLILISLPVGAEQLFENSESAPLLYSPTSLSFGVGSESSGYQDMSLDVRHGLSRESRLFAGIGQGTYSDDLSDYTQESYFVGFGTSPLRSVDINMEYAYWDQGGLLTSDTIKGVVEYISPTFSVAVLPEIRYISMESDASTGRVGIRNPGLGFQGKLFAMRQLSFEFSRYMYRYSSDTDALQSYPRRTGTPTSHGNDQFDKRRTILAASYSFPEWTVSLEWLEGVTATDESIYNTLSTVLLWDLNRAWGVQVRLGETSYRSQPQLENATYGNFGFNYRW